MSTGCIIVIYRNSARQLDACLASVRAAHITQVAVVDNGNDNQARVTAGKLGSRYIASGKNLGFAAAANLGVSSLNTDFLFFLNPDAVLLPNSLPQAEKYLTAHPSVGPLGFLLQDGSGRPELSSFGLPVTPFSLFTRHLRSASLPDSPKKVGWVSGGALLIRRSLFNQLGGFDPRFFLYWEDVDLCLRAHRAGHSCVLLPSAPVLHQRGASLDSRVARTRYFDQSADKYFRKHYPKPLWLSLRYLRKIYRYFSPLSS